MGAKQQCEAMTHIGGCHNPNSRYITGEKSPPAYRDHKSIPLLTTRRQCAPTLHANPCSSADYFFKDIFSLWLHALAHTSREEKCITLRQTLTPSPFSLLPKHASCVIRNNSAPPKGQRVAASARDNKETVSWEDRKRGGLNETVIEHVKGGLDGRRQPDAGLNNRSGKKDNGDGSSPPPPSPLLFTLSSHRRTVSLKWRSRWKASRRLCSREGNSSVLSACC